jgi:hypothetical protein
MRHLKVVVISALMAVPFGVAIYQDSKKSDKDRLRELMGGIDDEMDPYASDYRYGSDDYDYNARHAELERELAEMRARGELPPEEPEDEPLPESLDASSIRELIGASRGTPGPALSSLSLGMRVVDVANLPDSMMSWLDDGEGAVDARLALEYGGPNDLTVVAIRVTFADYGKGLSTISDEWGEPTLVSEQYNVFVADDGERRMILSHSDYANTTELVFSKQITAEALIAPRDKKRLGFEQKAILGASRAAIQAAYETVEYDDTLTLELPGFQGSPDTTTDVEITLDDNGKAAEIEIGLDYSLAPLLETTILGYLEQKYGARADEPEDFDVEFGKPAKVGVSTGSTSLKLHFFK